VFLGERGVRKEKARRERELAKRKWKK